MSLASVESADRKGTERREGDRESLASVESADRRGPECRESLASVEPADRKGTECREGDREVVYKEIKHLTMLKDVKQVVQILEVYEKGSDMFIVCLLYTSPSPRD